MPEVTVRLKIGEHADARSSSRSVGGKPGLTQEELAERAGSHRTYTSDVECGTRNVSLCNIERLAAALGLRPWKRSSRSGETNGRPVGEDRHHLVCRGS